MSHGYKRLSYSEFTRDKLEKDYNPILHCERFKHFININRKNKFLSQIKDELTTSNKALTEIKKGRYLEIDLNTRLNFKSVNELRTEASEDFDFVIDKYKRANTDLCHDLDDIQAKKRSLHEKIKANRMSLGGSVSVNLPRIDRQADIPLYKKRLLQKQR